MAEVDKGWESQVDANIQKLEAAMRESEKAGKRLSGETRSAFLVFPLARLSA